MRRFTLLLAVCFTVLGVAPARGDDASDIARAAKRTTSQVTTAVASRQRTETPVVNQNSVASRSTAGIANAQKNDPVARERTVAPRGGNVVSDKSRAAQSSQNVTARTATTQPVQARTTATNVTTTVPRTSARSAVAQIGAPARTAISPTNVSRPTSVARSAISAPTNAVTRKSGTTPNISRAAITNTDAIAAIASRDYKKCREVFYDCMDEFCANKDAQLKRCACSARVRDFDGIKKQMGQVEDKILNFSERLLTVNMDTEDALAISTATEGELAFNQKDTSASKKILDEISKKLKANTTDTNLDRNMSAISLSLDMDAAFDNIDSMMGADTTTKEGTALYNAALPICIEMVAEVCDDEGVAMAQSGYQMTIEQDCNTVAKAYDTLQTQAMEKVREGGALLDMARLDIHQQRNSDDILTCKKKMLDMLSDTSVCGENLGKCLDTTGRYIDPSTGQAFLTVNLVNLGNLITRPDGNQSWTTTGGNDVFVTYLNSKKKYLEPAMENCQDISDRVWDEFMEDALAQIKLAQEKKLEDVRQSCTSLTTQCLTTTATSVSEFDARALSIFGVTADKTVNEMCNGVKSACTALLATTGGVESGDDWVGGMSEIQTDKTFDTILQTCREVGKACIIQTCKSVSGNFGLCENVNNSINRKAIINRAACWNDVVRCVAQAGSDPIGRIMTRHNKTPTASGGDFYKEIYGVIPNRTNTNENCDPGTNAGCIFDLCDNCGTPGNADCATCRIAERIWGNCEFTPNKDLSEPESQNKIKLTSTDNETLLSWFAENTGTSNMPDSCRNTQCGAGYTLVKNEETGLSVCVPTINTSSDLDVCDADQRIIVATTPDGNWTNCCDGGENSQDVFQNCCTDKMGLVRGIPWQDSGFTDYTYFSTQRYPDKGTKMCLPIDVSINTQGVANGVTLVAAFKESDEDPSAKYVLLCIGTLETAYEEIDDNYPAGKVVRCNGKYVIVDGNAGTYVTPEFATPTIPYNYYNIIGNRCYLNSNLKTFGDATGTENPSCDKIDGYPVADTHNLSVQY